ncbi:MAG: hypothetical protein V4636_11500 [Pseudomonadota bacterium]
MDNWKYTTLTPNPFVDTGLIGCRTVGGETMAGNHFDSDLVDSCRIPAETSRFEPKFAGMQRTCLHSIASRSDQTSQDKRLYSSFYILPSRAARSRNYQ